MITDAGFRCPWFQVVLGLGWDYVGRVHGTVHVQPQNADPDDRNEWVMCGDMHALAPAPGSQDLGGYRMGRGARLATRLILHQGKPKDRHAVTVLGKRRQDTISKDAARAAREPWLLATSLPETKATAVRVAHVYAHRMTLEEGFRDTKSANLGAGFECSRTHKSERLANLLVLFALVQFAAWLVGWCEEERGEGGRLEARNTRQRTHHSRWRLGMEVLKRPGWWPPTDVLHAFLRTVSKGCPQSLRTAVLE